MHVNPVQGEERSSILPQRGKPVNTVGIVLNPQKSGSKKLAQEIKGWFVAQGVTVRTPIEIGPDGREAPSATRDKDVFAGIDCLMVLGGDGTLLRVAREVDCMCLPILGINLGHLGFLSEIELNDMYPDLKKLLTGEYHIEERMMLEAQVIHRGQVVEGLKALNDVVVSKGPLSRIITLDVYINEQYFTTLRGDGLIIATPTGSTAYSLSAGGPIVSPEVEMLLLTPVCPHTFFSRPVIIAPTQRIKVILKPRLDEARVTVDGQHGFQLHAGDEVVIYRSQTRTRLVRIRGRHFFEAIRNKLTLTSYGQE